MVRSLARPLECILAITYHLLETGNLGNLLDISSETTDTAAYESAEVGMKTKEGTQPEIQVNYAVLRSKTCSVWPGTYLGTKNNASSDRISNEMSMIRSLSCTRPMTPDTTLAHRSLEKGSRSYPLDCFKEAAVRPQLAECEAVLLKRQPGMAETPFVFAGLKGAPTCNKKCNAYSDDTQIP